MKANSLLLGLLLCLSNPLWADRPQALKLVREGQALEARAFTGPDGSFVVPAYGEARDTRHYHQAIEKYNAALKLCPDLPEAYAARSSTHYFLRQMSESRQDAITALRLGIRGDHYLMNLPNAFHGAEQRQVIKQCMKIAGAKSFSYQQLWFDRAQSYWYEGNFAGFVKELESLQDWERRQKLPHKMAESFLGNGYEALGKTAQAEKVYRKIGDGDALVRLYVHQSRWKEARAALKDYASQFKADEHLLWEAGISELEGSLQRVKPEQLAAAHRLGDGGNYYAFFLGLLQLRNAEVKAGRRTLQAFCEMCDSNPREWGVTLRWECAYARALLKRL